MARQDIAGLLTGISSTQRPNPNASAADWRMQFGQQQAGRLGSAVRGVQSGLLGGAPVATPQEAIQMGLGKLDLGTVEGLSSLARVQQLSGDIAGAAQTAARIKQMQEQKQKLTAKAGLIDATKTAITEKYGEKRKDLLALADQGMSLQEVDSFAKIDANARYKVVGNNVLDVTTGEYLPPPKGAGKEGYTVQKFYDAEKGANVVQFLDKADPSIVLREEIDTKDMGRQSATLLNLQAGNLEKANEAGKQAREANAVANRLEKAAAEGMTGGVIAQGEEFIKSMKINHYK